MNDFMTVLKSCIAAMGHLVCQKACIERVNGKFRGEFLSEHWPRSLGHAQ